MASEVNEQVIRAEVESRRVVIEVVEDWLTPSGRKRKAPMYTGVVSNDYLGLAKTLKAKSRREIAKKARAQVQSWTEREIRQRLAEAKQGLRARAEELTAEAQVELEELRNLLAATLDVDDRIDWQSLLETACFEDRPFQFEEEPPPVPGRRWAHYLWPPAWKRVLAAHAQQTTDYEERLKDAREHARSAFDQAKVERNLSIKAFRAAFEAGDPPAVEEYVGMVFERSSYPTRFEPTAVVHFEAQSETVVVDASVPSLEDVPDIASYKLVDGNTRVDPVSLKTKEHAALYDEAAKQLVLRMMHEVFEACYIESVQAAVVNLWTTRTDPATGHDQVSCILSLSADRGDFESIRLERVSTTECIKGLKGLIAGPLSDAAPVRPILTFNRVDSRFIESREQLADFNSMTNLAEISWQDFEHLVRELFAKMFTGSDAEVRVTRSSQDGGVDAVAFDPDPIRGGKFVIQAKRYTKAVSVADVRELYGTMISEGATKGILVTTAHFGRQARDFVKDKPVTLIDGSNLVYLLEDHGHRVRIDIEAARASRRAQSA